MFRVSIASLILSNLVPLFGVLFFSWDVSTILILYWSENVIIGFYNILKMALAQQRSDQAKFSTGFKSSSIPQRLYLIGFFIVHFGIFTFGHAVFVFSFFGTKQPSFKNLLPALLSLFVSHGISTYVHFIKNGEYRRVTYNDLFFQPYKRVFIMHLAIIFGAWLSIIFKMPSMVLVVLVFLKITVDIYFHRKEHTMFSRRAEKKHLKNHRYKNESPS
jgi:hypothetical protein